MPIYEFKCLECNEYFEILVARVDEDVAMECPKCHAENFERVMSTTNYAMGAGGGSVFRRQGPDAAVFKRVLYHL